MTVSMKTLNAYIATMLWSSMVMLPAGEDELVDGCMDVPEDHHLHGVSEHDNMDDHYDADDLTLAARYRARVDLQNFFNAVDDNDLHEAANETHDDESIAHDFWLTRNGHGAGFWDGDYNDDIGERLTQLAESFGECNVCVNNDGHVEIL